MDWNYIGGVERGECSPTAATIAKLADALDVPLSDLFAAAERGDFHTDPGEQGAGDRR